MLKSLAESTQPKKNFNPIFVSMPIFDGMKKEDFFECIEQIESACLQSVRNICNNALVKAKVGVRKCLLGLFTTLLLSSVRQKLKWYFSTLPTTAHAAVSLNAITWKPSESMCIYISHPSRLQYTTTDETACENSDQMRYVILWLVQIILP